MTIRSKLCKYLNDNKKREVTIEDIFSKCKNVVWNGKLFYTLVSCLFAFFIIQALTMMGLEALSEFTSYERAPVSSSIHIWTLTEYIIGFVIGSVLCILLALITVLVIYCVVCCLSKFFTIFKSMFNKIGSIKVLTCNIEEEDR